MLNLARRARDVRLFLRHQFKFWGIGHGDSIHYYPNERALIAYKDSCYFLMNASVDGTTGVDSWTTGHRDEQGEDAPWRDAEDRVLDEIGVSFGMIDGVIAVDRPQLGPGESAVFHTGLPAAEDLKEVLFLNYIIDEASPQYFISRTIDYWRAWVNKEDEDFCRLPEQVVEAYKRSLLVLRTNIDNRGGILAANDTDLSVLVHGM